MNKVEIKPDIYWVGAIDWHLRNFHGYRTPNGTTYNAYLIMDDKITLIDTVKQNLFNEMLNRIKEIVEPSKINYIVSNHVEMDHSGSLTKLLEICPNAKIITSTRGEKGLHLHYKKNLNLKVVNTGEKLNIGKKTLEFYHIPMVHWPDSMVTYIPSEKLLLPNDAFGQHIASSERFDDELEWGVLKNEAVKYYANIVMPYGDQVKKALETLTKLDINIIAPSHGIIWRKYINNIVTEYLKWANFETENKALIVYDSMWGSTEKIAYALYEGLEETGIKVTIRNLKNTHISDIMTDVLTSRFILLGSPTLNNSMLPTMGGFLTYLKGLKPRNRIGFVFGSYGWGGQAVGEIEKILKELSWDLPIKSVNINYIPDENDLENIKKIGKMLVKK
ncbi:MAG: FprA family A-type flavoprotein [Candidatus Thermoplasmatota archaeon]|nr:FprA family A-type flavoprotein [Candidatus Thermoplasmatota archaeon]